MIGQFFNVEIFKTCNHQISKEEWVELLRYLGHEVDYKEISDEDMQELM